MIMPHERYPRHCHHHLQEEEPHPQRYLLQVSKRGWNVGVLSGERKLLSRLHQEEREAMSNDILPYYPGKELEALSFAVNYHRWIIDAFEPYLGETIAEVGAGVGASRSCSWESALSAYLPLSPPQYVSFSRRKTVPRRARAKAVNDFFSPRYAQEGFDSVVYINVLDTSKMIALSWLMHERC